jgi:hypothetical protein
MTSVPRLLPLLLTVVVLFPGCAKRSVDNAPASYSPTPTRSWLFKDQSPEDGLGAYGYLIFTKRPSANDKARYLHACDSYLRTLEPSTAYRKYSKDSLMVTHWLLSVNSADITDFSNCQMLVDSYDFARATPIAKSANRLGSQGPILVAWATSYTSDLPVSSAMVFDLSQFAEDDFDRAFSIWKERIVQDPSVWNNGFPLIKIREAFRNLIQKYGEQICERIDPQSKKATEK